METAVISFIITTMLLFLIPLVAKRLILQYQWTEVRKKAKLKGLNLYLISDKKYRKRQRPMPRGGMLYQFNDGLFVRYERVSQERALLFLDD